MGRWTTTNRWLLSLWMATSLATWAWVFPQIAQAQVPPQCQASDLLLVIDHSGSMAAGLGLFKGTKWDAAKKAFTQLLTQYSKKLRFGLVTFESTAQLRVKLAANTASQCLSTLNSLSPAGSTAMKCALQQAYNHYKNDVIPFDSLKDRRRYVLVITDGIPNVCGTDVVSEVKRLRSVFVGGRSYDIKTYVVGFGSGVDAKQLQSMAVAGGTVNYYQADNLQSLQLALSQIGNGASREVCNNKDDDCDGIVDNFKETCQATCGAGSRTCTAGQWSQCQSNRGPQPETCNNIDDDCNGTVDENLNRNCQTACGNGTETCAFGRWVNCTAPQPQREVCDGRDNNCDGQVDENVTIECQAQCGTGLKKCVNGNWTACQSSQQPVPEDCNNRDDDCNGKVDDGLTRSCATACGNGSETCVQGRWVNCNAKQPKPEDCNGQDDDCDGLIDEQLQRECSTRCGKGTQACIQGDWSTCSAPRPSTEICDGRDNDCDGQVDVGATCPGGTCVKGVCFRSCTQECPNGYSCDKQAKICRPKTCNPVCADGTVCLQGRCVDADCSKPESGCPSGQVCQNSRCTRDLCLGVECASEQFCEPTTGTCRHSCAQVSCPVGQSCKNGVCEFDNCGGIRCPSGQACKVGQCVAQTCPATPCGVNEACLQGLCVPDRCQNVKCPSGQRCVDGECYSGSGPLPPAQPEPVTPADPLTDGGNGQLSNSPDSSSSRRRGGCVCSTNDNTNLPFLLFCLLLVMPLVIRRKGKS